MKGRSKTDHSAIIYNGRVTIGGIPEDAERYMLGSRSALAWIIDRYQVKIGKASGIVNDPNDWCDEHDDPTYVVELIKRITTVSIETMKIVDSLAETAGCLSVPAPLNWLSAASAGLMAGHRRHRRRPRLPRRRHPHPC